MGELRSHHQNFEPSLPEHENGMVKKVANVSLQDMRTMNYFHIFETENGYLQYILSVGIEYLWRSIHK